MHKGLFIVFEGIDGSGTTTQCELLARSIESRGVPVIRTREPGGTPLAEKIRHLVLDPDGEVDDITELLLYAASRAHHVHEVIAPALMEGTAVICDRFVASSLAYQGYGRGLGLEPVWQVNQVAVDGCLPDLTIYLDLPLGEASRRRRERGGNPDRMELAGERLQEQVARAYRELADSRKEESLLLDGTRSQELLGGEILKKLQERWPNFPLRS
ncbi:MAG: dTMP kinase [Gemmatimonadetes bacterium]|nr:dTMP kinase [Gemmatimonadota bacterium]